LMCGRTGGAFTTCSARLVLLRRLHDMHGLPRLARDGTGPLALLVSAPGAPFDVACGRTGGAFTTCSDRLALLVTAPPRRPPEPPPQNATWRPRPKHSTSGLDVRVQSVGRHWPCPRPSVAVEDTPLRRSQGEPGPWDQGPDASVGDTVGAWSKPMIPWGTTEAYIHTNDKRANMEHENMQRVNTERAKRYRKKKTRVCACVCVCVCVCVCMCSSFAPWPDQHEPRLGRSLVPWPAAVASA
jgi:hypothetical protein